MALTPTKNIPLGFLAPHFNLLNPLTNKKVDLNEIKGSKATVIYFYVQSLSIRYTYFRSVS